MTALDDLFVKQLPTLLARARAQSKAKPAADVVGFVATGAPESGAWVVRVAEAIGRRTTAADRPDVVVEASAAVFALLFSGALDVDKAIAAEALRISGDRAALERLRSALGGATAQRR
ncbi:MAG: SCP2 sterol-binding domain-containing protein [Deltaproteobacteria bacterium]|nr:SCP2 sterol-binding domain-containing protein [Deltaproteobacteria bacterium]